MITFIKKYLYLIKYGAIALAIGASIYYVYDYSKLKQETQQYEQINAELANTITSIQEDLEKQEKSILELRKRNTQIENDFSAAIEQINDLRDLTPEYIEENKPEVAKQINDRMNDIQRAVQCATGNKIKC